MGLLKKYWVWVAAILLVGLFCWLRFSNIRTSLFFFNDMGRDLLVLQDWKSSGKPPLLGPQTSSLPINQSAIYFYFLMPAFLIFHGSPLSLLYTNAFFYITAFLGGLWMLRKKPLLQSVLLSVFLLVSISPQYIIQSRFVWNPSLVTPFLTIALISLLLIEKFSKSKLWVFVFSLAISVSLSYSVAPAFIAIYLYLILFQNKNRIKTIASQILALVIVNAPTIAFELKHKFLLTSSLFSRGVQSQRAEDITVTSKFRNLFGYGLSLEGQWLMIGVALLAVTIFWYCVKLKSANLRLFSVLLLLTILVTFIVPITIHSHYIFGFTTLLFLCIATLPKIPRVVIIGVLALLYLTPARLSGYFKPAIRTVEQMETCFREVCKEVKDPLFVSVQAGFHPYHNGPEHRFMMKKAGCDVRYIEEPGQTADYMAVVLDDSDYVEGETKYNELTMFGESKESRRFNCQENFGVVILGKGD